MTKADQKRKKAALEEPKQGQKQEPKQGQKQEPKQGQKQEPKQEQKKDVIKVRATIRPMHSPADGVLIPDEGGALIKESSWAKSQLERGLLEIVE